MFLDEININPPNIRDKSELKFFLNRYREENLKLYLDSIRPIDANQAKAIEKIYDDIIILNEPYKLSQLAISGNDLLDLGFNGKNVGGILETLLRHVIMKPADNKKDNLISLIKN